MPDTPTYHALLIGCDAYAPGYRSLSGCVNDIDAIERLLLDPPGIGLPAQQIRVTRLAAPRPGVQSTTRLAATTRPPTKANIVAALIDLAGPTVRPNDRVMIYYSGHGDQKRWPGTPVSHEAIVPVDVQYLYDIELNGLIAAIAARTDDLTLVLDCCHSAGATRSVLDDVPQGDDRLLRSVTADSDSNPLGQPPDPTILARFGHDRSTGSAAGRLVQPLDPPYLAVVACQAVEVAGEGSLGDEPRHGVLTHSLVNLLQDVGAQRRARLRWADLWPALIDAVDARCAALNRRSQHPVLIGRSERSVFGGPWEPHDPGYVVRRRGDTYRIAAGSLMGLTEGAEVAVYGPEPPTFPPFGSAADKQARIGLVKIVAAERASCTAHADSATFDLPPGARGRLVKPGTGQALRVVLDPPDAALTQALADVPLLQIVAAANDAEVAVRSRPGGGWTIGNDIERELAVVPPDKPDALRAGLASYSRYATVLRLARTSNDPRLDNSLDLRLLDCDDAAALQAVDLADPVLPEVARDSDRIATLPAGGRFCLRVANTYPGTLYVTVFNCSGGGLVEYLGDVSLQPSDRQVLWSGGIGRQPFTAGPDFPERGTTDRLIAVATTRADVDLRPLQVTSTVQEVVDAMLTAGAARAMLPRQSAGVAELWTAVVVPVRIGPVR